MALFFFILFIITALFIVIIIFCSKKLSPIPYFPSQKIDLPLIIDSLNLQDNHVVFDLGAGDGIVIFEAAKKALKKNLKTKFVAVEINLILILILQLRRFFHPNKKNIKIIRGDMFKMSFSHPELISGSESKKQMPKQVRHDNETTRLPSLRSGYRGQVKQFNNITIYLYISPWFLDKVAMDVLKEFPKAKIVSYMYPIKSLNKKEKIIRGKNAIFEYS